MRPRLCPLFCALLIAVGTAAAETSVIFPGVGVPYADEMTIAFDGGGVATLDFPDGWDMIGDSPRLPYTDAFDAGGFQNVRYHASDSGYGLVMRNQMIAFAHGSAGAIALSVENISGDIDRLELAIGGFTRLSLETMPEDGTVLHMFYGIGGARVTLSSYIIAGGLQYTPEKALLRTDEEAPQAVSFRFDGGEVRLSASFVAMGAFVEQMPVSRPLPTGMRAD